MVAYCPVFAALLVLSCPKLGLAGLTKNEGNLGLSINIPSLKLNDILSNNFFTHPNGHLRTDITPENQSTTFKSEEEKEKNEMGKLDLGKLLASGKPLSIKTTETSTMGESGRKEKDVKEVSISTLSAKSDDTSLTPQLDSENVEKIVSALKMGLFNNTKVGSTESSKDNDAETGKHVKENHDLEKEKLEEKERDSKSQGEHHNDFNSNNGDNYDTNNPKEGHDHNAIDSDYSHKNTDHEENHHEKDFSDQHEPGSHQSGHLEGAADNVYENHARENKMNDGQYQNFSTHGNDNPEKQDSNGHQNSSSHYNKDGEPNLEQKNESQIVPSQEKSNHMDHENALAISGLKGNPVSDDNKIALVPVSVPATLISQLQKAMSNNESDVMGNNTSPSLSSLLSLQGDINGFGHKSANKENNSNNVDTMEKDHAKNSYHKNDNNDGTGVIKDQGKEMAADNHPEKNDTITNFKGLGGREGQLLVVIPHVQSSRRHHLEHEKKKKNLNGHSKRSRSHKLKQQKQIES